MLHVFICQPHYFLSVCVVAATNASVIAVANGKLSVCRFRKVVCQYGWAIKPSPPDTCI